MHAARQFCYPRAKQSQLRWFMPFLRHFVLILGLSLGLVTIFAGGLRAEAYDEAQYQADIAAMDRKYIAGDYPAAEAALRGIITKSLAQWGELDPHTLDMEAALANTLRAQYKGEEALGIFRSVHGRWLKAKGKYNFNTLKAGMQLSVQLSSMGRAEEGLPLAMESVRAAEILLGAENATAITWRYNLAGIFYELGYLEEARTAFAETRDKMRGSVSLADRRTLAIAARQVARAEGSMGRSAEAADSYAEALPLLEDAYGREHPVVAETLSEYALMLFRSRDPLLPQVLEQGARVTTVAMGDDSLIAADLLNVKALMLATEGGPDSPAFAEALEIMRQAIAIKEARLSARDEQVGKLKLDLAAMLGDTTDKTRIGQALAVMGEAEAAQGVSREFYYQSYKQAEGAGVLAPEAAAAEMFRVAQASLATAAARSAESYGARLALGQGEAAQKFRRATDLRKQSGRLQAELLQLVTLPLAERDTSREKAVRDRSAALEGEFQQLEAELRAEVPSLSDLTGGGVLSLAEAQAMLAPDEALVVVDLAAEPEGRHYIIALSRDRVMWKELLWTTDSFSGAVADIRRSIALQMGTRAAAALDGETPEQPKGFDIAAAHWLYAETLGQVAEVTAGKAHLYLDLRGAMASVPPHLLVVSDDGGVDPAKVDWLVRHHAVSVIPSVFSLKSAAMARTRAPAPEPLLAFADPEFDLAKGGELVAALDTGRQEVLRGALQPLPETAGEVREVAGVLGAPAAALRLGAAASEAGLKAEPLDRFRVLHFATHGLVAGDAVGGTVLGEPALALTPGRGEDGFLTVSEILDLRLNADWVVLSACNTAVGNAPGGEALSGLAQAFFYAGARGLLVSHWPVESRSAARLMTETFRLRAETPGLRAAEAQRQAMLAMIDAPGGRWSHPAYWSPFVLVGSPD